MWLIIGHHSPGCIGNARERLLPVNHGFLYSDHLTRLETHLLVVISLRSPEARLADLGPIGQELWTCSPSGGPLCLSACIYCNPVTTISTRLQCKSSECVMDH